MTAGLQTIAEMLVLLQRELLLFAAVFFTIGAADELAVDLVYIWLRLGRGKRPLQFAHPHERPLSGPVAVFIPAWQEAAVIAVTIRHLLTVWPHEDLRLYVGCYGNDEATLVAAQGGCADDPRLRIVVHSAHGPTTKSDCLNRLWQALCQDEQRRGRQARMVLLHDAEDMVDPAALALCDHAIGEADLVQLPVLALPPAHSRWIAAHYSDEFAEAHGKALVVRDALGAAVPSAGVGCAIARPILDRLAALDPSGLPFAPHALTEDYELGLRIARLGGNTRFLRARAADGRLIATRAYFPARLDTAVRQKTRWIHGIALQGWDRLGWGGSAACLWMQLRDRRGPLAALLLGAAYLLVIITFAVWLCRQGDLVAPAPLPPLLEILLLANFAGVIWRAGLRAAFTAREYGWRVGAFAVPRLFLSNLIAIMAGWRALFAYMRTLRGRAPMWDKTAHFDHPAASPAGRSPA